MRTILVVDDRTANRERINVVLLQKGFRVCGASDGIEALRRWRAAFVGSLRERVSLAGGRFLCESTAAQGTLIEIALPMNVT